MKDLIALLPPLFCLFVAVRMALQMRSAGVASAKATGETTGTVRYKNDVLASPKSQIDVNGLDEATSDVEFYFGPFSTEGVPSDNVAIAKRCSSTQRLLICVLVTAAACLTVLGLPFVDSHDRISMPVGMLCIADLLLMVGLLWRLKIINSKMLTVNIQFLSIKANTARLVTGTVHNADEVLDINGNLVKGMTYEQVESAFFTPGSGHIQLLLRRADEKPHEAVIKT